MKPKVIVFLRNPNNCPPDCECQKSNQQTLESLAKQLAQYVKQSEREDIRKTSVARGSAIYLPRRKY
jgi:hypothetical protein